MKKLEYLELQEVGLEEIISYSKLDTSPIITILDDLNYGLFNQFVAYADTLKLIFFIIKGTNKVAVIGNRQIALKIAEIFKIKAQYMYYTNLKPKKLLGKTYAPKEHYRVQAYNENGKPTDPFIDTNIKNVNCDSLTKYDFKDLKYAMKIRGSGNNKIESIESIRNLRKDFLRNGKI